MRIPTNWQTRVRNWCSTTVAALALVLAPVAARAGAPGPESPDASQPAPPEAAPPTPEPPPTQPDGVFAPIEIPPPPPLPQLEPPPEPEPIVAPEPEPPVEPPVEGPKIADPDQIAKIQTQRKAGVGVMIAGGAVAAAGFGLTLTYTILGDKEQQKDDQVESDIEQKNSMARVGGLLLASGVALVAIGAVVFANANKKNEQRKIDAMAKFRVVPAIGGLVVSGRF